MTVEKEWAAINDDRVVMKRDTKDSLRQALWKEDLDEESFEIVALPKAHTSFWIGGSR